MCYGLFQARASTKRSLGGILAKILILIVVVLGAGVSQGAQVTWSSGIIYLPDGSRADTAEVTMYALVRLGVNYGKFNGIDFYAVINDGLTQDMAATKYEAFFLTAQSDAGGGASVTTGMNSNSEYQNEMAVVLFVCEYDDHEWYKQVYGDHYSTAAWPEYTNENMASRGEWIMGNVISNIPEPTTLSLSILGLCMIVLHRRKAVRNERSS